MVNLDFNYISQAVASIAGCDFVFSDDDRTFVALNYSRQNVVRKKFVFAVRGESAAYFLNLAELMHLKIIYRADMTKALFDEFNSGKLIAAAQFEFLINLFAMDWNKKKFMNEEEIFKEEVARAVASKITQASFDFYNKIFFQKKDALSEVPVPHSPLTFDELFKAFEDKAAELKAKFGIFVNKSMDFKKNEKLDLGIDVDEDISKFVSISFDYKNYRIHLSWIPVFTDFYFYEYKKIFAILDIYFACDMSPLKLKINEVRKKYQMNFKSREIAQTTVNILAKQILGAKNQDFEVNFDTTTGILCIKKDEENFYEIGFSYSEINSNPAAFISLLKDIKPLQGEDLYCVEYTSDWKAFVKRFRK